MTGDEDAGVLERGRNSGARVLIPHDFHYLLVFARLQARRSPALSRGSRPRCWALDRKITDRKWNREPQLVPVHQMSCTRN